MADHLGKAFAWLGIALVLLVAVGYAMRVSYSMPDHAVLFLDDAKKLYLSPPCLVKNVISQGDPALVSARKNKDVEAALDVIEHFVGTENLRPVPWAQIKGTGYKPDPDCRDQSGFTQDGRSLTGLFLEAVGLLPPLPSRWNPDGSWKW